MLLCKVHYGAAGGIIGYGKESICYNSINLGKVVSTQISGGIIGNIGDWGTTIKNCFSSGNILGVKAGGILGQQGWATGELAYGSNCYYLLSETVNNSVGKANQTLSDSLGVEKLQKTHIDDLNKYIEDDPDELGTADWKKWTLDKDGIPSFVD